MVDIHQICQIYGFLHLKPNGFFHVYSLSKINSNYFRNVCVFTLWSQVKFLYSGFVQQFSVSKWCKSLRSSRWYCTPLVFRLVDYRFRHGWFAQQISRQADIVYRKQHQRRVRWASKLNQFHSYIVELS